MQDLQPLKLAIKTKRELLEDTEFSLNEKLYHLHKVENEIQWERECGNFIDEATRAKLASARKAVDAAAKENTKIRSELREAEAYMQLTERANIREKRLVVLDAESYLMIPLEKGFFRLVYNERNKTVDLHVRSEHRIEASVNIENSDNIREIIASLQTIADKMETEEA